MTFDNLILGGLILYISRMVMRAAVVLYRVYYPVERRRFIVYAFSDTFTMIYRMPAFEAQHGFVFERSAQRKARELIDAGKNVFVQRNIEVTHAD